MPSFKDIPQFTRESQYRTDVSLAYVEETLQNYKERQEEAGDKFELCPDFQRGHVWTENQQIKFIEFILRGGKSGREIYFNHPGWQDNYVGDMVCVDGLQRLTAIQRFLNNEIKVFGYYLNEFEDQNFLRRITIKFNINNLKTKKEVLNWYIEMNAGGTPHTDEEIERVKNMLDSTNQE